MEEELEFNLPKLIEKNDNVQAFAEELRQLAQLSITQKDDPVALDKINQRIKSIKGGLDPKEHQRIEDIFNGYVSVSIAGVSGDRDTADARKLFKDISKANLGIGALETGVGIIQAIRGHAEKNKLTPPKLPDNLTKNPRLQNQINEVTLKATEGDKELRGFFESKLAELDNASTARAKSTGGAGQFASNVQANRLQSNKALQEFSAQEAARKDQAQTQLGRLIGQDINEDLRMNQVDMQRFNVQNRAYNASMLGAQSQVNSGLSNAFQGLRNVGSAFPYVNNTRTNQTQAANTPIAQGVPTTAATLPPLPGAQTTMDPFANQPSIGEMIAIGNSGFRTPESILKFQNFAADNLGLQGYSEGVFDNVTEEAYNNFYYNRYNK